MNRIFASLIVLGIILVSGCEKSKLENEMQLLDEYLLENGITTEPTSSGIYYIETVKGNGPDAKGGDKVKVKYTGKFLDGEVFDSGMFTFPLGYGYVIPGWDEGISYMNVGGKAILIIPSSMGYGADGYGDIPGYTSLVFDVELLDII